MGGLLSRRRMRSVGYTHFLPGDLVVACLFTRPPLLSLFVSEGCRGLERPCRETFWGDSLIKGRCPALGESGGKRVH